MDLDRSLPCRRPVDIIILTGVLGFWIITFCLVLDHLYLYWCSSYLISCHLICVVRDLIDGGTFCRGRAQISEVHFGSQGFMRSLPGYVHIVNSRA